MELLVVFWIFVSFLFALAGTSRKIGFGMAFIACLLLSPIIGLILILLSEKKTEALMKLKIAYDSNTITQEEYNKEVRKIKPNREDRQNMLIGYAVVGGIALVIYLITLIL